MASDGSRGARGSEYRDVLSDQQIADHDAALHEWAKSKLAEVEAASRGSSSLAQFVSRTAAEFYAIEDAAGADVSDAALSERVRSFYRSGGFFPTGRVGSLYELLRPSCGDSRCRMLCKAAKDESSSDPRAATIDAKIQSLWDAIQAVLNSAFARAQNEPHDNFALEQFCHAWDAVRDYIPRSKANEGSSGALSNDSRTIEVLNLLRDAPDREAGIAIAELPAQLRYEGLFTEWLAADLIEVIQRNHCHTGGGPHRKLILENGWNVAELSKPNPKRVWQLLQEALGKDTEPEIRLRVRLGRAGDVEIARLRRNSANENVDGARLARPAAMDKPEGDSLLALVPTSFSGGEMLFQPDRVLFCGIDICSGPRSASRRQLLELLSQRQNDGSFVAYGGEVIAQKLRLSGGNVSVAGLVRDLRDEIVTELRDQAGIDSDRQEIILSGGPGYRLNPSISIRYTLPGVQCDLERPNSAPANRDNDASDPVHDDPVPDDPVHGDPVHGDPNDPDLDPDTSTSSGADRQSWILHQLAEQRELRAPHVVRRFKCSMKTAKRTLNALKEAGKIEYVGDARTGTYRLKPPPVRP